ncbi:hypothetical protein DCAR_0726856 [Daucus carota subsp. sativus]|uniref:non-specific serine/threonine protein kinase n=1 Tax=Daucus carota subsp. sativus TaxID=79200 RepID=A0AAF0XJ83_DAUCS|nr:hypothetical protein DCAR_0726856 [Daucus carota subsp. sativus]
MVLFAWKKKENELKKEMQVGRYELGRTLGEGNFGKVKYAKNLDSGQSFAVKILEKARIVDQRITDQIKREIGTLKLLRHPNVVRLHEVIASKTKIYMVLEYVNGGELFERIASRGKLSEAAGRKMFQQLIDAVTYCHNEGVIHRDLKLENVLVDTDGNIKISDFGLSALPQHFREDGLLHTTCGSPNYVAPEVLQNRGYDGATSDTWSCGVILYVFKGTVNFPKGLSPGAKNLIRRILDPNPRTRITIDEIKQDQWFRRRYTPVYPVQDKEGICINDEAFTIHESSLAEKDADSSTFINAFRLISMASSLDLSGFFEKEDVSERTIRFTSHHSPKELMEGIEDIVTQMGFLIRKRSGQLKVVHLHKDHNSPVSLSVAAEVFDISPSLYLVEVRRTCGDAKVYRQLCEKLSHDLGVPRSQELLVTEF